MARSTKSTAHLSGTAKEFEKTIRGIAYRHQLWRVFSDWCEMTATALGNVFLQDPKQEARYMEILKNYTPEEQASFPKLLALTTQGLEDLDCDFLGGLFMGLELSGHWHGQFFTPFSICKLLAKMNMDGMRSAIEEKGFARVMEPACGAGAMILGLANAMREEGLDYQRGMHVTAVDIDATAANMCFIQLALHHIPATVVTGDTLTLEERSVRYTPAYFMGGWSWRLKERGEVPEPDAARVEAVQAKLTPQLTLF